MIAFELIHPRATRDDLGYIPEFFSEDDPRPAREQIDANYAHGGGWQPNETRKFRKTAHGLQYPGDPPMLPIAQARLHDELIQIFLGSWLCITQPDGSFEVARVD